MALAPCMFQPSDTLPESRSLRLVQGTLNSSTALFTSILPLATVSNAFTIDSLLHCQRSVVA